VLGDFLLGHTRGVEFHPRDERDLRRRRGRDRRPGRRAQNVTPLGSPEKLNLNPGAHHQEIAAKLPHAVEKRCETGLLDDAEVAVVAFGFAGTLRQVRGADLSRARHEVGWVRPISLWPFPDVALAEAASRTRALAVFEQNAGR